jgi:hypothetical protein
MRSTVDKPAAQQVHRDKVVRPAERPPLPSGACAWQNSRSPVAGRHLLPELFDDLVTITLDQSVH